MTVLITLVLCWSTFLFLSSSVNGKPINQLIDMTYTFNDRTPTWPRSKDWPTHKYFSKEIVMKGYNPTFGNIWVESYNYCSSEHAGTHMDAPVHFSKHGRTIDVIPGEKLYRVPGVKIDVSSKTANNPDYKTTVNDLEQWVEENGELPDGVVVLFETGWGKKALDPVAYGGIDENGTKHFPGLGAEAGKWLLEYGERNGQERGVLGYGTDTYSMDASGAFDNHILWLTDRSDRYGIENVKNVHLLPARGFTLTIMPMKIGKGSGGPTRLFAEIGGVPYIPQVLPVNKEVLEVTKVPEVPDAPELSELLEVTEVTEVQEGPELSELPEMVDMTEVQEVSEVTEMTKVTEV